MAVGQIPLGGTHSAVAYHQPTVTYHQPPALLVTSLVGGLIGSPVGSSGAAQPGAPSPPGV